MRHKIGGGESDPKAEIMDRVEWLASTEGASQETRLYAKQVVAQLETMPPRLSSMACKMAGGANIIEAAKEMQLDLKAGIELQQAVRSTVRAMFEVDASEKRTEATIAPHAVRRSVERYGLDLSSKTAQVIASQIESGHAIPIRDEKNRMERYKVIVNGKTIPVAYDKTRRHITTVFPPRALTEEQR